MCCCICVTYYCLGLGWYGIDGTRSEKIDDCDIARTYNNWRIATVWKLYVDAYCIGIK